ADSRRVGHVVQSGGVPVGPGTFGWVRADPQPRMVAVMNRLNAFVASLRGDRRTVPALGVGAVVVVFAGALIANPLGKPGPSAGPSTGPTAEQSPPGSTDTSSADASPSASDIASVPASQGALVPADIDGMLVDPSLAHRTPIFVSIDDASAARPQSGFNAT